MSQSVRSAGAKRTVSRRCRAQYSGDVASAGVSQEPVAVETMGMRGSDRRMPFTVSRKGATAASIIGEWNACDVWSSRLAAPSASSVAWSRSTASVGPETTHRRGPLSDAMASPSVSRGATASADRRTDSMLPGACACMSCPRFATRCSASSSVNTPARHAATNSPTLWPTSASGRTPQLHQSCASAYSTVKRAACANDVWRRASAASGEAGSLGKSTSRRSRPSSGFSTSAHASTVARKAGAWRYSPCAMSGCCEP
ncbi:hypothetical protein COSO111634_22090 [Corallococcus soli]